MREKPVFSVDPQKLKHEIEASGFTVDSITVSSSSVDVQSNATEAQIGQIINDHVGFSLSDAKRIKKDEVNSIRDKEVESKFPYEIDGAVHWFDSEVRSAIRIGGVFSAATFALTSGNTAWSQWWRDADNHTHEFDAMGCIGMFQAAAAHESATVAKAVSIKAQIDAMETLDQVNQVNTQELWDAS